MRRPMTAILAALTLGLSACGGDGDIAARIADDLESSTNGAVSGADARCAADAIVDALGADRARSFADAMDGDLDAAAAVGDIEPERFQAMGEGLLACDVDGLL